MNEKDVIDELVAFISKGFPKKCGNCDRVYLSIKEYIENTEHLGRPISYDADNNDWNPSSPIGTLSLSNCSCGSTLAIDSRGMSLITMWRLMRWARSETKTRGVGMSDLLAELRIKVDQRVLQDEQ